MQRELSHHKNHKGVTLGTKQIEGVDRSPKNICAECDSFVIFVVNIPVLLFIT
jgi:hypothetical protein